MFILRKDDALVELSFKTLAKADMYGRKNISKGIRFSVKDDSLENAEILFGVGGVGLTPVG